MRALFLYATGAVQDALQEYYNDALRDMRAAADTSPGSSTTSTSSGGGGGLGGSSYGGVNVTRRSSYSYYQPASKNGMEAESEGGYTNSEGQQGGGDLGSAPGVAQGNHHNESQEVSWNADLQLWGSG